MNDTLLDTSDVGVDTNVNTVASADAAQNLVATSGDGSLLNTNGIDANGDFSTDTLTASYSATDQSDDEIADGTLDGNGPVLGGAGAAESDLNKTNNDPLSGSAASLTAGAQNFAAATLASETSGSAAPAPSFSGIGNVPSNPFVLTGAPAMQSAVSGNPAPTLTIVDGGSAENDGISGQSVSFAGSNGMLILTDSVAFTGQIAGMTGSDAIDFADLHYDANMGVTYTGNAEGGTLTVTNGTQTTNINLVGDYLSSAWNLSNDGNGGTTVVDPTWTTLDVGGGGWVTGLDIAPNGTMVARTDTYGAYIWNGTQWQQLVTATSMPAAFVSESVIVPMAGQQGVDEIQVAPSNSSILYMMYDGYVFESSNDGTTWTQTSFSPVSSGSNDAYRMDGERMAIDPNNPNIVYVGTIQNGLFVTTNGGAAWQSVSAVPASTSVSGVYPGITGILFDPEVGGTTNGNTNTIFASSYGNGVYQSTNAGASWTHLSGGPSNVEYAAISSTGVYYAIGDAGTDLWSFANGTWTELLTPSVVGGNALQGVAINSSNPSEIVAITDGGSLDISYNGGATWSGDNWSETLSSSDIPWLTLAGSGAENQFMAVGGIQFSPTNPNELIVTDGIGVWTTTIPTSGFAWNTPVAWNDQTAGIENLVAREIVVPPGGDPVLASEDRAFFYINNATAYPSKYAPTMGVATASGWSLDYASSDPSFLAGIAEWGTEESGYSTDGGKTWTPFASFIPGADTSFMGGTIAASTPSDIVWAPAEGNRPYYTLNGGQTWNPISLPGVTSWSNFNSAAGYWGFFRTVAADRVLANTFYLYYPNYGVFETTNGGVNWTEVHSGSISPTWQDDAWNSEIQSVPGEAGNLFFTAGPLDNGSYPDGVGFYRSTNQGATWSAISNVQNVICFGFGAPAPGQSYPAIYIAGYVGGVYGVWQSVNNAQSWTQIGTNPVNSIDNITTISGDPNVYGQVYVGFSGSGYAILTAPPSVTSFAASPSTGVESTGQTINITLNLTALVTVTGTPTLSLNDGGTATYVSGSGTNALTFSYTVGVGQSTSALAVTAANLPNGATITDDTGTSAVLTGALTSFSGLQISSTGTGLMSITESPSSGDFNAGNTITLTLNMSGNVTVNTSGGTPTLTLNDGGTATYTGGSGTSALTFSYTVGAGQNTAALAATAVNLNGATITDGSGNAAIVSLTGLAQAGPQIDATTPTFTAIAESPSSGDLNAGKTVTYSLTTSEAVTVNTSGGSPTISLNDGGTATYVSGSGTNALTFSYTVLAGQNTPDLMVSAVTLNGATMADGGGNVANLSLTGLTQGSPQIDTTPPIITSASAPAGDYNAGQTLTLTLNLSEPVNVTGTPTLSLNDGGTATYVSGSGSSSLTFSYTVGAGQNTGALALTGVTGTITDLAGNALSTVFPPPVSGVVIGATSISSITETPSSGDLNAGHTGTLTLNMSEAVTVNTTGGTPTLTLNDGGTATYSGGSGTNALTFSYTVAAGQNSAGLAATAVNLNGATITDGSGNAANLSFTGLPQLGPQIDTTTPILWSLAVSGPGITNGQGDLGVGKTVTFTIGMSEAVTVANGTPSMTLNDGGTATYVSGSGTNALVFTYTVMAGQNVANLEVTTFNYNGATITDGAGNAANVSAVRGNPANGLQIDTSGSAGTVVSGGNSPWIVSNGQTDNGDSIISGGTEVVSSGGTTIGATVSVGGTLEVVSGGRVSGVTVSSGGTLEFLAGASDPALTVLSGGTLEIGAGYTETGYTVANGVTLELTSGGTVSGTTVSSGGTETVSSGGIDNGTTLIGGTEIVSAGGTATGTTVSSGGTETVFGSAASVKVLSGSTLNVSSGGITTATTVSSGGTEYVTGTASGAQVSAGGTETVSSGGIDNGTTLIGGAEMVSAGGTATSTTVSSGGTETVFGSAANATVLSGGTLNVSSGGIATATTVSSGGMLDVLSGATVSSITVLSGGTLDVSSGGVATGITVSSGGNEYLLRGGHTSGTVVHHGGFETVSSGGVDSGTTLAGGTEYVLSGGVDPGTVVSSGGMDVVYGSTTDVTVLSGGEMVVSSGGVTSGTQVSAGGLEYVSSGGVDSGTAVNGGTEIVSAGGMASGMALSGGVQYVYGSASGAAVLNGSIQDILAGGAASGTTLSSGGFEYDNGTASGTTVSGGTEYVFNGGTASGTTVNGGNEFVFAGGLASRTSVSGGVQYVYGSTNATAVLSGAIQDILAGGAASGTTLSGGGFEYDNGTASGTTVNGGTEFIFNGGTASGTIITSGNESVFAGGSAKGTTVMSGGTVSVLSGGTADGSTISGGGYEEVLSGGLVNGATISGGTLELQNGANGDGTFNFASGGMLTLDGTGTYNMLVAGFTSATAEMDLTSINYAGATVSFAEASNNTSGTLTVANGASSASVLLLGNYVAGAASFTLEKDSGGGTIVFDPPVVAGTNPNGLATPHHS